MLYKKKHISYLLFKEKKMKNNQLYEIVENEKNKMFEIMNET